VVVNDAYNANPTSMRAAILDLDDIADGRRRVAILGEMAELGDEAMRYHAEVGRLLAELGVEVVVAVGDGARGYLGGGVAEEHWVPEVASLDEVAGVIRSGDAVLVKGSRAVGLEGVPSHIANLARQWSES